MVTGVDQCCHMFQTTAKDPENPENRASTFIQKLLPLAELIAAPQSGGGVQPQPCLASCCLWRFLIPQTSQHPQLLILITNNARSMTGSFDSCALGFCTKATWWFFLRKTCDAFCTCFFDHFCFS